VGAEGCEGGRRGSVDEEASGMDRERLLVVRHEGNYCSEFGFQTSGLH